MYFLLEKMCLKVKECLEGQIIKRTIKRGKSSDRWGNEDHQDIYYFDANDRCYIRRANKKQIKFPIRTRKIFEGYEDEMWSDTVYKLSLIHISEPTRPY